jgi:voltage-gated potassium channel
MLNRFSGERLADLKLRGVLLVIVSIAAVAALGGAVFVRLVDPGIGSFGDALWWAVATVTTTGFGDVVPTEGPGRVVGVLLMFVGISLIPTVTSLIVSVFVAQRSRETAEADRMHREEVMGRLERIEAHLASIERAGR